MTIKVAKGFIFFQLIILVLVSSCSSYQRIENKPGTIQQALKSGDKVKIITHNGQIYFLKVTSTSTTDISGKLLAYSDQVSAEPEEKTSLEPVTIVYKDIKSIRRGEFSPGKTAAVGVGVGAGVAAVYMVIIVTALKAVIGL